MRRSGAQRSTLRDWDDVGSGGRGRNFLTIKLTNLERAKGKRKQIKENKALIYNNIGNGEYRLKRTGARTREGPICGEQNAFEANEA